MAPLADRIFCRPLPLRRREPEHAFLAAAARREVRSGPHQIVTYTWHATGPTVLLMHGWGSYAGRWRVIGAALHSAGYRVVALDAPAHGDTGGHASSLPEFAAALAAVAALEEPVHAVVGHSLGASAIPVAMQFNGLRVPRAVLISPTANPVGFADQLQRYLWWTDAVQARLIARLERRLGFGWRDLSIPTLAAARTEAALLLHDADDTDIPHADGAAIAAAWRGCRFETTRGLGHREIMRTPDVANRIIAFLRQ